ncbi:MAG: zinc transporter ZupT [Kiritimatiellia bacterium]|jgi:ZIP family zinc transporter|nr:zinc transporter ZupT [Kiritimatiellia bacterium]MDD4440266.1 zinc transporter ZupT [Kiritimatiellia bacterium]MDX9794105.1 zinc transporter ZupT [Kiritimatiellia bacterium]NLC79887.1 zinc transporter ZupT [Lentisphaerota bacterium]
MREVWIAFGLTVFAGLATGIGSVIAFMAKRTDYRFLSVATGFSAGVMLYVSFVEIFVKGTEALVGRYGDPLGHWINAASFFGGMLLIGLIDNAIPSAENPHETHAESETRPLHDRSGAPPPPVPARDKPEQGLHDHAHGRKLMRMGLFTALAITIHNFPEGLATFLAALQDPGLGIAIAIAVALHNIPEGISVSVPIYYATGNRRTAFFYSLLSGLAEPVGAGVAYLALRLIVGSGNGGLPPEIMGVLFGGVAGIMVYISLDELLPTSRAYGKGHDSLFGLAGGMVMMALSLLLMKG